MKKSPGKPQKTNEEQLLARVAELESRLAEAEETLRAIRNGEVDALIASTPDGDQVFTLSGAERPYRIMLEMLKEGTASLSPDGTVFYCNHRFAQIVRTPLERVIGSSILPFMAPDSRSEFEERFRNVLSGPGRGEFALQAADGTTVPAFLSWSYYPDGAAPVSIFLVATDITELKEAQETLKKSFDELETRVKERTAELQESEERFRSITDSTPVVMWMTDARGDIEFVNAAYRAFFGVREEQLSGPGNWQLLVHPVDAEGYIGAFSESLRSRSAFHAAARVRNADGAWRWIESYGAPRFSATGEFLGIAGSSPEITARKISEEALEKKARQLEAANKELESFSYSVSHDLRAPLRTIDGFVRMLLKKHGHEFDADSLRKFNVVRRSVQMMGQLIDDILTFSRLGRTPLSIAELDMDAIIREIWRDRTEGAPEKRPNLTMGTLPRCRGDLTLLRQVVENLIGNAVKFTRGREEPLIEAGGYTEGPEIVFYIRDNGVGFDMEYHDKMFDVFQRLHNTEEYEGTGVGLAIVKRLIHRHGGRVWAEGKPGKGATFYFALPNDVTDL